MRSRQKSIARPLSAAGGAQDAIDPIVRAFQRLAARSPTSVLIAGRRRRATVADVDALSRAVAAKLSAASVLREGQSVLLAAANGAGFLASFIAIRRLRLVPILVDASTPDDDRLRIAGSLGSAARLECATAWPAGEEDWSVLGASTGKGGRPAIHPLGTGPLETGLVKLTSGTTGDPQGIATTSEALVADHEALFRTMGLKEADRYLAVIPFSHAYGLSVLAMSALMRGSMLVLAEDEGPYSGPRAADIAQATVFPTVPSYLQALSRLPETASLLRSLRLFISAGAPLAPETAVRFRESFGRRIHVFYGASECGGICYDREGSAGERGSVGTPVEGVRIRLRGAGGSEDVEEGTIVVSSRAVASGYLPPASDLVGRLDGGSYVSRDIGRWRDGELVLLGRSDPLINVNGKKVNPREVESILEQLEGVKEAVVLGLPVPQRTSQVVRAVVACDPGSLTYARVIEWCRSKLPAHKVPRSILLVDSIPRTSRGKLDRTALLAPEPSLSGRPLP